MMEDEHKITTQAVPYKELKSHITKLEGRLEYPYWDGFDKEWRPLSRLYEQPPKMPLDFYASAIKPENRDKNRYGNALPPEETRVKLKGGENDYINASWVKGTLGDETKYIVSQGPMPETFADFWRMVWETESLVIVMLTREVENGRAKCERYWNEKGKPLEVQPFTVELLNEEVKDNGELFVRTFKISNEGKERTVYQYQYTAWPDQGIPPTFRSFLDIVNWVNEKKGSGPIVVHCSAGLGRSGAFAMVHNSLLDYQHKLKNNDPNPTFHMEPLVIEMRKQRHGLIQTGKQFEFVYRAIAEGVEELSSEK